MPFYTTFMYNAAITGEAVYIALCDMKSQCFYGRCERITCNFFPVLFNVEIQQSTTYHCNISIKVASLAITALPNPNTISEPIITKDAGFLQA